MGHAAFENGGGGRGGFGNFDFSNNFSDIFEDFFGEGFGGERRSRRSNNRGSDLRYDLSILIFLHHFQIFLRTYLVTLVILDLEVEDLEEVKQITEVAI